MCPEVSFYCFQFLPLTVICAANEEQCIDYFNWNVHRSSSGIPENKTDVYKNGVEPLALFLQEMFCPEQFVCISN